MACKTAALLLHTACTASRETLKGLPCGGPAGLQCLTHAGWSLQSNSGVWEVWAGCRENRSALHVVLQSPSGCDTKEQPWPVKPGLINLHVHTGYS
jgi:hypothetical protein